MPAIPAINLQNAREFQRLSVESRMRKKMAVQLTPQIQAIPEQITLHAKVLEQMQDIDNDWKSAKPVDKPRLAQAKAQLWSLLFPKPKPSRGINRRPTPTVSETPQEPATNPAKVEQKANEYFNPYE